ncbi:MULTISPECIES: hypothetical protein [Streptomyces]|uniref:Uncharacterized protein n=1 Tax=Streptomyces glycanivorans TaxID=3033808 RepID=A0ABY9J7C9_9ACTN|nr:MULTISPECIES: hypothetical protein [unclassified Streptomyces]TXS12789.1 hypothetical protein EAO68_21905 [Streptomyces sp. wa22]WLQ62173.1 hypothetical protein P8A20_00585 [Streptomyces sp. Alt3]WSQ75682.1 hypothetical protein OG725_00695 [Streptomyces sp. NBC_01213]WSQ82926.1 hypothetical protein OG722_00640 [Streptomyces sp. NBC_01212]
MLETGKPSSARTMEPPALNHVLGRGVTVRTPAALSQSVSGSSSGFLVASGRTRAVIAFGSGVRASATFPKGTRTLTYSQAISLFLGLETTM